jgi:DNA gyrase subunit A
MNTKDEDFVEHFLHTSTHADLLFFTDKGKVYQLKAYDIPEGKRATKGKSIMNFLSVEQDENVTSVLPMTKETKETKDSAVFMCTKAGVVKKVDADSFFDVRRSGIKAINLKGDDSLIGARFTGKDDTLILASKKGQSVRFKESDVRSMGRTAGGVKGFTMKKDDEVISLSVIKGDAQNPKFFVFSENGYGKQTDIKEYKIQKRGGSGIKTVNLSSKIGDLITGKIVTDETQEVVAISKKGVVIRISLDEVPNLGRQTQGVRIMKLRAGDSIASIVCF